ncbi:glycosyltransferase family 2 protein [Microvirga yunnanensis]|nr:glycosyltransferase family 2 protein [Microvirga sp. HBU67655]
MGRAFRPVSVSIIMPVRNEAKHIGQCLRAILAQDYPSELIEIIIADGLSTDDTRAIIAKLAADHPETRIAVLDNPLRIAPSALNLAIARSTGDVILRIDGHTFIASDYVSQCVAALQTSGADNVGGGTEPICQGRFGEAVSLATGTSFGVGHGRWRLAPQEQWVDTVYLGAWPRRVFEEIGLFDEEQVRNQDDEFNYRLREHGGSVLMSPHVKSSYYNRSTPRSLWRQYYQYGYWKVRVMQKHPSQMRARQFIPPLFVLTLLLAAALAPFTSTGLWMLVLVAGCYAAANIIASVWAGRNAGLAMLPSLMAAFAILHVSYGSGFLVGLAHFWNRWGQHGRVKRLAAGPDRPASAECL